MGTCERTHLWYPFWTDKTARLDDPRTCAAEPVNEPHFDVRGDDCLLILKPIPGTHFNNLHGDLFASCSRIGFIPQYGKRGSRENGAGGSQHGPSRAGSYSKRHAQFASKRSCVQESEAYALEHRLRSARRTEQVSCGWYRLLRLIDLIRHSLDLTTDSFRNNKLHITLAIPAGSC